MTITNVKKFKKILTIRLKTVINFKILKNFCYCVNYIRITGSRNRK